MGKLVVLGLIVVSILGCGAVGKKNKPKLLVQRFASTPPISQTKDRATSPPTPSILIRGSLKAIGSVATELTYSRSIYHLCSEIFNPSFPLLCLDRFCAVVGQLLLGKRTGKGVRVLSLDISRLSP
jgi:hypothetical protein